MESKETASDWTNHPKFDEIHDQLKNEGYSTGSEADYDKLYAELKRRILAIPILPAQEGDIKIESVGEALCLIIGKADRGIYNEGKQQDILLEILEVAKQGYDLINKQSQSPAQEGKEEKGATSNFMQTIPDSHFWTSIEMLINWAKMHSKFNSRERSVEYLVKGLENTLKNGYDISKQSSPIVQEQEENDKLWDEVRLYLQKQSLIFPAIENLKQMFTITEKEEL